MKLSLNKSGKDCESLFSFKVLLAEELPKDSDISMNGYEIFHLINSSEVFWKEYDFQKFVHWLQIEVNSDFSFSDRYLRL